MKSNKISSIPPVIENDQVVPGPQQKADIFNNFFASKLFVKNPQDPDPNLPPRNDIFEKLNNMNTSPIEEAKLCRDINKSCSHCQLKKFWPKSDKANYCDIHLLPTLSKIAESVLSMLDF